MCQDRKRRLGTNFIQNGYAPRNKPWVFVKRALRTKSRFSIEWLLFEPSQQLLGQYSVNIVLSRE